MNTCKDKRRTYKLRIINCLYICEVRNIRTARNSISCIPGELARAKSHGYNARKKNLTHEKLKNVIKVAIKHGITFGEKLSV